MSENTENYKPFIAADKVLPEFTSTSIILGLLLSVIFGAANAYLGLKAGMTISASIPAAVISMGIIRGIMRKESILENNMVQTIGSAGESLAAGAIFTLPALYIWTKEWGQTNPDMLKITAIALCGGLLGVFFMIPLRKALIVKEHGVLPYPEGTACAEVLLAGEAGGSKAAICFTGLGLGAVYKLLTGGFKLFSGSAEYSIEFTKMGYKGGMIGIEAMPALLGVGFIIGPRISAYMIGGAVLGWLGIIPLIANIGSMGEVIMYPSSVPIAEMSAWDIWDNYIRYVGAGAVAFGGIFSLIKSLPLIWRTFADAMKDYKGGTGISNELRTDKDLSMKIVIIGVLVVVLAMMMLPAIPVGFGGGMLIAVFGFFFATVSSRIVGLVGSSSNPVSGMTIATLIITAIVFKTTGNDGQEGMIATLTVGAVICIIASMAGDTSQDLKTGFLVGATPKKQQIGEFLGAVAAALVIGYVLTLLDQAWGFGSKELPAPQATLMRLVIEGVMGGNLPWSLVFTGVAIGITIECLGLPVLPIAIGLYLPIHLSSPIIVGGLIRGYLDIKKKKKDADKESITEKTEYGILYSSGLIAGEGLMGILLAVLAVNKLDVSLPESFQFGEAGALFMFALLAFSLVAFSIIKKVKKNK